MIERGRERERHDDVFGWFASRPWERHDGQWISHDYRLPSERTRGHRYRLSIGMRVGKDAGGDERKTCNRHPLDGVRKRPTGRKSVGRILCIVTAVTIVFVRCARGCDDTIESRNRNTRHGRIMMKPIVRVTAFCHDTNACEQTL